VIEPFLMRSDREFEVGDRLLLLLVIAVEEEEEAAAAVIVTPLLFMQ